MLASANETRFKIESGGIDALGGVTVAFAPAADGEIRDGVVVRFEHFRVAENFIAKRVQPEI